MERGAVMEERWRMAGNRGRAGLAHAALFAMLLAAAAPAVAQSATATGAVASPTPTGGPNLNDVDDVLDGQRVLADVVDLVVTNPAPQGADTIVSNTILETANGSIDNRFAQDLLTTACGGGTTHTFPPFPQVTRTAALFDLPDVVVTLGPTAAASGADCSGALNLALYVNDVLNSANNSTTALTLSAAYVQLAVGDFSGDGYDDVLILSDTQALVATAVDVEQPSAGLTIGPATSLGAMLTPMGEPTVADFNRSGFRLGSAERRILQGTGLSARHELGTL